MNYLRKYNTALSGATRIPIPARVSSGALATSSDYTPATGDSKVSIDCGTEANTGTALTWDDGTLYLTLSAAELSGKLICVRIIDAAIQNEVVYVETFGHASAMYPTIFNAGTVGNAPAASDLSGAGSGAFTYTVTVTSDGSTPVNGARVRLTGGAEDRLLTVGADGVAAFSVDAGSYTLSITASGYTYTPTTVSISATATATVTLTAVNIPSPASPAQTTAYTTCRDGQGAAAAGAVIEFRFVSKSDDDSYDRTNFSATSNGSGLLTISLPKSATMQARRRPKGDWVRFTTGTDASCELPQALSGYGS